MGLLFQNPYTVESFVHEQRAMRSLADRLARGEADAFAELYDEHAGPLHAYLASRLESRDAAADVLQEVFLRVVAAKRKLRRVENLRAYLFRIARNEAARRRSRKRLPIDRAAEPDDAPAREPSDPESAEHLAAGLARLAEADREIVSLKLYGGLTFREIAETLSQPQGTVATRYRRALARLREELVEES